MTTKEINLLLKAGVLSREKDFKNYYYFYKKSGKGRLTPEVLKRVKLEYILKIAITEAYEQGQKDIKNKFRELMIK